MQLSSASVMSGKAVSCDRWIAFIGKATGWAEDDDAVCFPGDAKCGLDRPLLNEVIHHIKRRVNWPVGVFQSNIHLLFRLLEVDRLLHNVTGTILQIPSKSRSRLIPDVDRRMLLHRFLHRKCARCSRQWNARSARSCRDDVGVLGSCLAIQWGRKAGYPRPIGGRACTACATCCSRRLCWRLCGGMTGAGADLGTAGRRGTRQHHSSQVSSSWIGNDRLAWDGSRLPGLTKETKTMLQAIQVATPGSQQKARWTDQRHGYRCYKHSAWPPLTRSFHRPSQWGVMAFFQFYPSREQTCASPDWDSNEIGQLRQAEADSRDAGVLDVKLKREMLTSLGELRLPGFDTQARFNRQRTSREISWSLRVCMSCPLECLRIFRASRRALRSKKRDPTHSPIFLIPTPVFFDLFRARSKFPVSIEKFNFWSTLEIFDPGGVLSAPPKVSLDLVFLHPGPNSANFIFASIGHESIFLPTSHLLQK